MAHTVTSFDAFLKDNYDKAEIAKLVNEEHVALDMLDTGLRLTGRRWIVPFVDGNPQGVGSTVAAAQAGAQQAAPGANIQGDEWTIAYGDYSAHVEVADKVMAVSSSDMGAFFEDKKEEIDGLYRTFGDVMSSYILRDAGRALGSFTISTGVCTLVNKSDIVNFEKGMLIQASADDGTSTSHALLGSGSIGYCYAVNYNAGTFTVATSAANAAAGTAGTPASWTGTMYAFRNSDFGGTSSPNRVILGYGAWCPPSDPSDTFEGVNRALDPLRRGGVRLTAAEVAGLGLEQRIKRLSVRMASRGIAGKKVLLHPEQWQALADSLEARGNRPLNEKVGQFNFSSLKLATPKGMVDVFADKFMPIDAAYMFDPQYIKLGSVDGFPKVVNGDGLTMLRKSDANTYEYRLVTYPAYCHKRPSACGRVPLLTP